MIPEYDITILFTVINNYFSILCSKKMVLVGTNCYGEHLLCSVCRVRDFCLIHKKKKKIIILFFYKSMNAEGIATVQ